MDEVLYQDHYGTFYKIDDKIMFKTHYLHDMSFEAWWVPESMYEWFCNTVGKQYHDNMRNAHWDAKAARNREIKNILGLS